MKTIIAGSRSITSLEVVEKAIEMSRFGISEVVCGGARGVDDLGRKWAGNGNKIPVKMFPADWSGYGYAAGPIRNCEMANYADALIAVWDGRSKGTWHMIKEATKRGLVVFVYRTDIDMEGLWKDM